MEFSEKEIAPLASLDVWEDDVLLRYPEESQQKSKQDYRNYDSPERDTVREFYRLNHKFQTFDFVKETKTSVLVIMKGSGMFFKKIDITD